MNTPGLSLLQARGELAITPEGLAIWASRLCSWDGTAPRAASPDTNWLGDSFPEMYFADGMAVLEIFGPLALRPNYIEKNLGALGYDTISDWLDAALAKGAKGIVLSVSSPGGSVTGMIETAQRVAEVAAQIPLAVFTDDMDGSAAFALSAGAGRVFCTQSAMVGSIGCVASILDASAFYQSLGLKFHNFASGKLKSAGDSRQPMSADHASYFAGMVQSLADDFKIFVSQYRDIDPDLMDGRIVRGTEAVQKGFADGILPNLQAAINAVASGAVPLQRQARGGYSSTGGIKSKSPATGGNALSRAEAAGNRAVASGRAIIATRPPTRAFTAADFRKTN